jgi:3-oxoacyl-(acyl-carrier-protein) synthase/acyl carrier protein
MNKQLSGFQPKNQATALATVASVAIDSDDVQTQSEKVICQLAAELLKLDVSNLSVDEKLGDYGFDSILMTRLANSLNDYYQLYLQPTVFFNYPTIRELSAHLSADYAQALVNRHGKESTPTDNLTPAPPAVAVQPDLSRRKKRFVAATAEKVTDIPKGSNSTSTAANEPIAIVGMSGRFPGSPDLETFWKNLEQNKDLITEIPKNRWNWEDYDGDPTLDKRKTRAKWGGFIEDVDKFDPLHFSISPREAELMDPQHRIALEAVWHALEDAGIAPAQLKGSDTGIFVGVSLNDYSLLVHKHTDASSQAQFSTGIAHSMLVNRISYLLDVHGPSEPVDTACSSSLIALHRAVESIRNRNCGIAIAGGVNALLSPELTLSFSQAGMLSENGRCRTFDQRANGYVRGEGVGMVVLKPLSQARADGNRIHALIRSTAENHGGKANTLTSPNPKAQKDLLIKAYGQAGIDPRRVSYIEAHGTGTSLGDPVEVEGLKEAFKELYKARELAIPATPHKVGQRESEHWSPGVGCGHCGGTEGGASDEVRNVTGKPSLA